MSAEQLSQNSEIRDLFKAVELGLDARQFLESALGKYVAARHGRMYAATQALAEVDPFDHKAIVQEQLRHRVASAALSWLAQAIEAGSQAETTLMAMDTTD